MRARSGFTLLELMAALGLGLVVLAAAYHLMFQTIFAAAEGEKVVVESQLARSLLNLMAADLRGALPGEGDQQANFSGTANRVSLCTARVRAQTGAGDLPAFHSADIVTVTYSTSGGGEGTAAAVKLVREQRPAVQEGASADELDAPDAGAPVDPIRRVLADTLAGVGLRYSDGGAWREDWDSRRDGGPPKAVEIVLAFVDATPADPDQAETDSLFPTEEAARTYRLVVYLPTGGRPEDVSSLVRRRRSGVERHMEKAFTEKWKAMTGGVEREMRRTRMPSARASGRASITTSAGPSGGESGRKTRAGAWGLRPMD